ncbi:hypothetical protein [Candidatus Amarolinea dominans]|uniref:hypothetical protein n=1 Tax=Candidatus Amarolinea dominans TaxID=3140696 RepID=UPI0031CCB624
MTGLFLQEFTTAGITDRTIKMKLEQALDYFRRIQAAVQTQKGGVMQDRLGDTVQQINDWLANMFQLARRLDAYRRDEVIKRDMRSVPTEISNYRQRLNLERDASVRQQMEAAINAHHARGGARPTGKHDAKGRVPVGAIVGRAGHHLSTNTVDRRPRCGQQPHLTPAG